MSEVLNCGKHSGRLSVVRSCRLRWEGLEATDQPRERYCGACDHVVHRVHNVIEARLRAEQGECIAVPERIARATRAAVDLGDRRIVVGMFRWTDAIPDE